MWVTTLVFKEIAHRPLQFVSGIAAVAVATVGLAAGTASLRGFDKATERILEEQRAATEREMATLEDELRKSMKGLGFNIHIFPEGQDLSEVYSQGYASKTMPESHAERLANSDVIVINHLLPSLTIKAKWPETGRTVLVIGVKGEIPQKHRSGKILEPMLHPVPSGHASLGHELVASIGLKKEQRITFMGKEFVVDKCEEERGSIDDITIWLNLKEAQALFGKEGQINSILALECNCATVDRLGEVRREIGRILPGVEIIEVKSNALARAEARLNGAKAADAQTARIAADRHKLKRGRERASLISAAILAAVCAAWIAYLTHFNVTHRWREIGTLLSIGVARPTILLLFLLRAAATGAAGAVAGWLILCLAAAMRFRFEGFGLLELLGRQDAASTFIAAIALACAAAWIPALWASLKDPADILRE